VVLICSMVLDLGVLPSVPRFREISLDLGDLMVMENGNI